MDMNLGGHYSPRYTFLECGWCARSIALSAGKRWVVNPLLEPRVALPRILRGLLLRVGGRCACCFSDQIAPSGLLTPPTPSGSGCHALAAQGESKGLPTCSPSEKTNPFLHQ